MNPKQLTHYACWSVDNFKYLLSSLSSHPYSSTGAALFAVGAISQWNVLLESVGFGWLTQLNLKLDSATKQSQQAFINNHGVFEMYSTPWYKTQVGIFAQENREYIGKLGI
jgi:hypothetical protein